MQRLYEGQGAPRERANHVITAAHLQQPPYLAPHTRWRAKEDSLVLRGRLPLEQTIGGVISWSCQRLRDRAMLSVGLQVGLCRSEIIRLNVRDLLTTRGCDARRVIRKRASGTLLQSIRRRHYACGPIYKRRDMPMNGRPCCFNG